MSSCCSYIEDFDLYITRQINNSNAENVSDIHLSLQAFTLWNPTFIRSQKCCVINLKLQYTKLYKQETELINNLY